MTDYEVQNQPIHHAEGVYEAGDVLEDPSANVVDAFSDNLEAVGGDDGEE